MRRLSWVLILTVFFGCVEPFEFDVSDEPQGIVVDGYISDLSYNDLLSYPQDSRYFEISLKYASIAKNVRDEQVLGANVELSANDGEVWDYAEIGEGKYGLFYDDFKAEASRRYMLTITLPNGTVITSSMESLPESMEVGSLSISEKTKLEYDNVDGETQITEIQGIDMMIETVSLTSAPSIYYKWDFLTTWIYDAVLADDENPFKYCWSTTEFYFSHYVLLEDKNGEAKSELFFLETYNPFLNNGLSVLIRQSTLSRDFYEFWNDVKSQENQGDLFAPPPYNVSTNLTANNELEVYGYFGVIGENYVRWYYDEGMLSYDPGNPEVCVVSPGVPFIPPMQCLNCLDRAYEGVATNQVPTWWNP